MDNTRHDNILDAAKAMSYHGSMKSSLKGCVYYNPSTKYITHWLPLPKQPTDI